MAVNALPTPTSVMQIIEENGVRFISFDGLTWSLYEDNEDNPFFVDVPTSTGGLTDAQRAQLIADRNIPDGTSGMNSAGDTWIRVTEGTTMAYVLFQTSPVFRKVYSLIQPT